MSGVVKGVIVAIAIATISYQAEAGIFLENCRDGSVYSENMIAYLQEALKADGAYEGKVDGKVGPSTKAAFSKYREKHGLPREAGIDLPLLKALLGAEYENIAGRDFRLKECARLLSGSH